MRSDPDASDFGGSGDQAAGGRDLATRFRRHADAIEGVGRSPLSVALIRGAADDLEHQGILAELLATVPLPAGQAPALRVLGALHRVVLQGLAPELARYYPSVGGTAPPTEAWPVAEATLRAHAQDMGVALRRGVQTNEPGRSTVLYGVLLRVAHHYDLPVRLFEIGASAGLNLMAPHFAYRIGGEVLGSAGSPVLFHEPWVGSPVPDPPSTAQHLAITVGRGCDIAPIDATSAEGQLTLLSFIWSDEPDRIARSRGALALAEQHRPRVDKANAAPWLESMLHPRAPGSVDVIWHSVFAQYLSEDERSALIEQIGAWGAAATASMPLVWARMEPDKEVTDGFGVRVTCWPGGDEVLVARSGDHGPPVRWSA